MREDRNPNLILKPAKKKNKANHKTKSNSDLEFENKILFVKFKPKLSIYSVYIYTL